MIKVKALRSMAKECGLKTSVTAVAGADRIAYTVIGMACAIAKEQKSPKLEAKHFEQITIMRPVIKRRKRK
jgi:hypothetical protein